MRDDLLVLTGADFVLPDRILERGAVVVEGGRIVEIRPSSTGSYAGARRVDLDGHVVVPGFVDTHVHGVEGFDSLDGGDAVAAIAARMPRHGVTAFCPTTVACPPNRLNDVLEAVDAARVNPVPGSARVLAAHLESNFLNPDYCGAQPASCLRLPPSHAGVIGPGSPEGGSFSGGEILAVIERHRADVGIVTIAPELPGALDLVRTLRAMGSLVSLGHSGATFEQAIPAIEAGASRGTHLFNRMPPLGHREPGLAGAVLASEAVTAEIVCDTVHVHPAMIRVAVAAKGRGAILAISDGLAAAGLPAGSTVTLGGRRVTSGPTGARLDDGTLAGSAAALGEAFALLAGPIGLGLVDAVHLCSTTPARSLGLTGLGIIAPGAFADLVVLDARLSVRRTFVAGVEAARRE